MRYLITGSRVSTDAEQTKLIEKVLDSHFETGRLPFVLIHGGAAGVDAVANAWARGRRARGASIGIVEFHVTADEWRRHGRDAEAVRNERMLNLGKPDVCIAFPGERSTADILRRCAERGIRVLHG